MNTTPNAHIPTIVYVEDNAGDAVLLQEALGVCGHPTVLTVIDEGAKALRYFQVKARAQDVPPPHCVLLDSHLAIVTGVELLHFLRSCPQFNDTPVYIFATKAEYLAVLKDTVVSDESFLAKPATWKGFLELADLLMRSATAKQEELPANATDQLPEVHPEGALRPDFIPGDGT
jgi:CheY-like chemotaxis protein